MDPEEYDLMFRVETWHWWYRGMEKITLSILDQCYTRGSGQRILDAGCGTGAAMLSCLNQFGTVAGIDISDKAIAGSKRRGAQRLSRASVTRLPFSRENFDLVVSFDVLYEQSVCDDALALSEFYRVLECGGRVFLRLPAYDWLRGQHDQAIHTARRYTVRKVARLLKSNGFIPEFLSYANTLLFPIALVKRLSEKIVPPKSLFSDLAIGTGIFNIFFQKILEFESILLRIGSFPFGLSVIAVGRKP